MWSLSFVAVRCEVNSNTGNSNKNNLTNSGAIYFKITLLNEVLSYTLFKTKIHWNLEKTIVFNLFTGSAKIPNDRWWCCISIHSYLYRVNFSHHHVLHEVCSRCIVCKEYVRVCIYSYSRLCTTVCVGTDNNRFYTVITIINIPNSIW